MSGSEQRGQNQRKETTGWEGAGPGSPAVPRPTKPKSAFGSPCLGLVIVLGCPLVILKLESCTEEGGQGKGSRRGGQAAGRPPPLRLHPGSVMACCSEGARATWPLQGDCGGKAETSHSREQSLNG